MGSGIIQCEGTVLQRRLALAEAGKLAESYLSTSDKLAAFCLEYSAPEYGQASPLLKNSLACESGEKNILYYVCEVSRTQDSGNDQATLVLESCTYSLDRQTISCEDNSVVTTFAK